MRLRVFCCNSVWSAKHKHKRTREPLDLISRQRYNRLGSSQKQLCASDTNERGTVACSPRKEKRCVSN